MPPEAGSGSASASQRHAELTRDLLAAVLGASRGSATEQSLRQAVEARAALFGGRATPPPTPAIPEELAGFVDRVAREAYNVTDEDVRALLERGYSEQAIFEITASAA